MKSANCFRSSEFLTVRELAWLVGSQAKVWRAIRTGTLPHVLRRGRMLVPARAIADLRWTPTDGGAA